MWEVKTNVINRDKGLVKVVGTRTDDVTGKVWTYRCTGNISTPTQRLNILQQIKDAWLNHLALTAGDDDYLAGLADTAANSLNTWEGTL